MNPEGWATDYILQLIREHGWAFAGAVASVSVLLILAYHRKRAAVQAIWEAVTGKSAERLTVLNARIESLLIDRTTSQKDVQDLTSTLESMKEENQRLFEENAMLQNRLKGLRNQYSSITKGKIWRRPIVGNAPRFMPYTGLSSGPPIISIFNQKGGVGKTTIAANLAATLWNSNSRVLLVDLDHQGSLTEYCLSDEAVVHLTAGGLDRCPLHQFHEMLVRNCGQPDRETDFDFPNVDEDQSVGGFVKSIIQPINETKGAIIPTNGHLDSFETRSLINWVFGNTKMDVRFILRSILHQDWLRERFDYVIVDCPPRLTTSSINALTSSHFVLIPAIPDILSLDAVPRTLHFLNAMREAGICPQLKILGVVANKARDCRGRGSKQEQRWHFLSQDVLVQRLGVHMFSNDSSIPRNQAAEGPQSSSFTQVEPALRTPFNNLAAEIKQEIAKHASRTAQTVFQ